MNRAGLQSTKTTDAGDGHDRRWPVLPFLAAAPLMFTQSLVIVVIALPSAQRGHGMFGSYTDEMLPGLC